MNERALATIDAVHQAVVDLILEGGVPAVTLSAVCQRAGISKGGLMHHFPSKEAMVGSFVDQACQGCLAEAHSTLAEINPGDGKRTAAFVDLMLRDPAMASPKESRDLAAVMIAMMQGSATQQAQHWYDTIYRELRGDGLAKPMIDLVISAIDGLWLQSMVLPTATMQTRAQQLRKQLKRVIKADVIRRAQKV
ncbi:MAG: TetR/AcrR family transcriptional regulator [Planctomycetota bacterium]